MEHAGILDETLDPALDGVAPEYYRAAFQTPAFTRERWGREFESLDYVEGGLSALHDLVVLRRLISSNGLAIAKSRFVPVTPGIPRRGP